MTYEYINEMVKSIGLPYAYYQFTNDTAKPCPFICFYYSQSGGLIADNTIYAKTVHLVIELYTDEKDWEHEELIEQILNKHELPFTHYESYIDSEKMLMNTYETEVYINE